jgi:hypothetical protein
MVKTLREINEIIAQYEITIEDLYEQGARAETNEIMNSIKDLVDLYESNLEQLEEEKALLTNPIPIGLSNMSVLDVEDYMNELTGDYQQKSITLQAFLSESNIVQNAYPISYLKWRC